MEMEPWISVCMVGGLSVWESLDRGPECLGLVLLLRISSFVSLILETPSSDEMGGCLAI